MVLYDRRACGGKHMAGGGREETAHVSGQDGRSRESSASRQQGTTIVRLKGDVLWRKAGHVFVIDLWVRKDATSVRPGFHRQA